MTNQPDPEHNPKTETRPIKQFTCPECGQDTLPLVHDQDDLDNHITYYCSGCETLYKRER